MSAAAVRTVKGGASKVDSDSARERREIQRVIDEAKGHLDKIDHIEQQKKDHHGKKEKTVRIRHVMDATSNLQISEETETRSGRVTARYERKPAPAKVDSDLVFLRGQLEAKKRALEALLTAQGGGALDAKAVATLKNLAADCREIGRQLRLLEHALAVDAASTANTIAAKCNFWSGVSDGSKTKPAVPPRLPSSIEDIHRNYVSSLEKDVLKGTSANRDKQNELSETRLIDLSNRAQFWADVADKEASDARNKPDWNSELPANWTANLVSERANFFSEIDDESLLQRKLDRAKYKDLELERVTELSNFWREMTESGNDDPKSQADINPDFLKRVKREVTEKAVEDKKGFWSRVGDEAPVNREISKPSKQSLEQKEKMWKDVVHKEKQQGEADELSGSGVGNGGDWWQQTDVEVLCDLIHSRGEAYDDGTAAIDLSYLRKAFTRGNLVSTLLKARKYGLVYFEGETVAALDDCDAIVVLLQPIDGVRTAFADMRRRHPDLFPPGEDDKAASKK